MPATTTIKTLKIVKFTWMLRERDKNDRVNEMKCNRINRYYNIWVRVHAHTLTTYQWNDFSPLLLLSSSIVVIIIISLLQFIFSLSMIRVTKSDRQTNRHGKTKNPNYWMLHIIWKFVVVFFSLFVIFFGYKFMIWKYPNDHVHEDFKWKISFLLAFNSSI